MIPAGTRFGRGDEMQPIQGGESQVELAQFVTGGSGDVRDTS